MSYLSLKVSIIIPHYNMASQLKEAVESVKRLNYKNKELIIIDDGSDETVDIEQLSVNNIPKFKLLEIPHSGKPTAVNKGFKEAQGDFIIILDADDYLPQNSVSLRIKALNNANADLCIGSFVTKFDGEIRGHRNISKISGKDQSSISGALLIRFIAPLHQNSMMFSNKLLQKVGEMNPRMKRGQDKDFALRLLQKSTKTVFVDKPVYIYNRYQRPLKTRLINRLNGTKHLITIVMNYFSGVRRLVFLMWIAFTGTAKIVHDVFGIYKK